MTDVPESVLDKRVIERNIEKGLIDRKQYEQHLGKLHDAADNAEAVELGSGEAQDEQPQS